MNPVQTKEEAAKLKYNRWAGNPKGVPYNPSRCVASVVTDRCGTHQCQRKPGHGPDGLYCKQHDPVAVKQRDEARQAIWAAKWAADSERHRRKEEGLQLRAAADQAGLTVAQAIALIQGAKP